VYGGYRNRYAHMGDIILTSIKSIKIKPDLKQKLKKGDVIKVLILQTRASNKTIHNTRFKHFENVGTVISNNNKIIGTRVFARINPKFRTSKYLKVVSLSKGVYKI
jgi:large subunit ribosomal protein L14